MKKYIMLIATLFWAGAFIAGKFSIAEFPVISLVFFRFLIATIIIFPVMIKKEANWKITKEEIPTFLKLGVIGMVGYHIFFFWALKYTTATNSSLIGAINPTITAILAGIILKDKIEKKHIISIILSLMGVTLIASNGDLSVLMSLEMNKGDMLMILAVICWAVYSVLSKRVLQVYSPIKVTAYSFLTCVIVILPFVLFDKPLQYLPRVTRGGWMSVIYMSVFASVIGYLIQQISIKNIGPAKTNLYINLVPVFSMTLAYFILGEKITVIKIVAGIFIVSGIFISNLSSNKKENKSIEELQE